MKRTIVVFFSILTLGVFLRFWHLGGVPISPNWDEVALGYNAYSFLVTGKDEYGISYPLVLRSFGNYTPALYSYLAVPAIAKFSLTPFATRLPSAVMGSLAVVGVFFLAKELFALQNAHNKRNTYLALITMLLFAISPWHIQFSRIAYEASIAFTLIIYGFLCFLVGLRRPIFFIASALFYGLAMNAYHSPRVFVPLFVLGLFIMFRKQLLTIKQQLLLPLIVGGIFLLPFVYFTMSGQSQQINARFAATNIFAQVAQDDTQTTIFNPPLVRGMYEVSHGYLSHFSPKWLFVTGDNDRHHAPSTGLLYLWELPFVVLGLVTLMSTKGQMKQVFFLWFLLVPVAASLTSEVPHAVRTLIFLPTFQLATTLGLERVFSATRKLAFFKQIILITGFFVIVVFSFLQYFHLYFYQMNHESSRFWQFGYEHAVNYVQQNKDKYKKVVVSNKLEQPYIFFLFYTKYDPASYLAQGGTDQTSEQQFANFVFTDNVWSKGKRDGSTLFIIAPEEQQGNVIHSIRYFDGGEAILFAE